jgi:predicted ribosome quality control (RQC) complex YloA/Tae2 family protein
MNVDALTLSAVADELERALTGARIEEVIQPTPQSVALQCWGSGRNRWVIASVHPQLARVHLVDQKPRKLVSEPPAFVMLLRKHLEGARIVTLRQPRWERVLEVGFARGSTASAGTVSVWLMAELMGRLSNLILRDDAGAILGALRLVGAEVNRYRTIAPHVAYRSPPPQSRLVHGQAGPRIEPGRVTAEELREAAEDATAEERLPRGRKAPVRTVAGVLSASLLGFGRDLSEEAAARALGAGDVPITDAVDWEAVALAVHELAQLIVSRAWQPTLVYSADEAAPREFAVYVPTRFPGATLRAMSGVNAMLAAYYEGAEWRGAIEGAKGDPRRVLNTQRDRTARKDEALRAELQALDESDHLRREADILLAFQSEVPPSASRFTIEDPFLTSGESAGRVVTIALDPRLSAVQNANRRYERYHKLQRAATQIPAQIEANALEQERIAQLLTDLDLADTPAEIALVRSEVAEAGYLRGHKSPAGKQSKTGKSGKQLHAGKGGQAAKRGPEGGPPLRRQSGDGFTLLAGKNSRQNEQVTFHDATSNDMWLHARGVPGAHVIVKSAGRPVPEATLREAAALAAYYSQARGAGSVPVDYTQQRYVRHMKGGGTGMVVYDHERTMYIAPQDAGGG